MSKWIASYQKMRDDPRVLRLRRVLAIHKAQVLGHLQLLELWALDHALDGDCSRFDALDLADAAEWDGDPEAWVKALIECGPGADPGFLDADWQLVGFASRTKGLRASQEGAVLGNHNRWHRDRGVVDPECDHCIAPPPDPESPPDPPPIAPESPPDSTPDQTPNPHKTRQHNTTPEQPHDDAAASSPTPDDGHDAFWDAYPRHKVNGKPGGGGAKQQSQRAWKRLKPADRAAAMAALPNYADWVSRPEGEFPTHASTWLNQRRWEDWTQPAPPTARGRPAHAASDVLDDAERHNPEAWR